MTKAQAVLAASLMAPAVALAFETVDTLPWPSSGRFPAYASEASASPTDLWVQGGVMYDDNLLRLETGALDDTVVRFGGGFRHAQRVIGRQTLVVDARADYYSFDRFDDLAISRTRRARIGAGSWATSSRGPSLWGASAGSATWARRSRRCAAW